MAADSKMNVGKGEFSYPADKIIRVGDMIVGAAGDGGDAYRFREWAKTNFSETMRPKWSEKPDSDGAIVGIILKPSGIHIMLQGDPSPELVNADYFAIGSGGSAARVAMKLGKTPAEAVALAAEVDENTGPPVTCLALEK